jgi:hypothetical protein
VTDHLGPYLEALKEHSPNLVFENQAQAVRLLMRARNFGYAEAYSHVHVLSVRRLIRDEKIKMEQLQPPLELVSAEAPQVFGPRPR